MAIRRWRRCFRCKSIRPAGEFSMLCFGVDHYHARGGSNRRCPVCHVVGFTQWFKNVTAQVQSGELKETAPRLPESAFAHPT